MIESITEYLHQDSKVLGKLIQSTLTEFKGDPVLSPGCFQYFKTNIIFLNMDQNLSSCQTQDYILGRIHIFFLHCL